ncbi:MAG: zf-HC2 domain-containing protein [Gammaproteobacteria bacterium]|nr:zf-HC2 domain-containing protein [Gammaproteobacteria bacterium]MCF6363699.1 zf-HC2 domain-containing protein [Gammaproteobacteria bacterium]
MKMMPSCREITEQASDYLNQDLSPWQRAAFRMHLLMCVYCRRHVKHLGLTVATLGKIAGEEKARENDDIQQIVALIKQQQEEAPEQKGGD